MKTMDQILCRGIWDRALFKGRKITKRKIIGLERIGKMKYIKKSKNLVIAMVLLLSFIMSTTSIFKLRVEAEDGYWLYSGSSKMYYKGNSIQVKGEVYKCDVWEDLLEGKEIVEKNCNYKFKVAKKCKVRVNDNDGDRKISYKKWGKRYKKGDKISCQGFGVRIEGNKVKEIFIENFIA